MNQNYDYVQVDPRVIKMLGGDDTVDDPMGIDSGADISPAMVESFGSKQRNINESSNKFFPQFNEFATTKVNDLQGELVSKEIELLKDILNELKEIKVILAGRM